MSDIERKRSFYIGRGADYNVSLEAALKLKEISYIQAEGFAAGELKHGTIALIEEGTPAGVPSSIKAIVPCFNSPAAKPSAWM